MIKVIDYKNHRAFLEKLEKRSTLDLKHVDDVVYEILNKVKDEKDQALKFYTKKFDGVDINTFLVSKEEIQEAIESLDENLKKDLQKAKENIEAYHQKQVKDSYTLHEEEDIILGQIIKPIRRVGIYTPGGTAAYPSTVLMNAIPAKIAGVKEIVMITPPNQEGKIKPSVLYAAYLAGVDEIYKVGGAQGIAALAFGTDSIKKVSKITGPGNIYVATAKKQVSQHVGIDMMAGPSEILILADETAHPAYVAADLISQAEHDTLAASILITDSEKLAKHVIEELEKQVSTSKRKGIIKESLKNYGGIIITECLKESIEVVNEIAPEHLEILTKNPFDVYKSIHHAGAIFLGPYAPEPLGDYFAGPNHTLPTNGTAKFASPLSVDDFIKKTSLIYYSQKALSKVQDSIIRIAEDEGLYAHANAIRIRGEEK